MVLDGADAHCRVTAAARPAIRGEAGRQNRDGVDAPAGAPFRKHRRMDGVVAHPSWYQVIGASPSGALLRSIGCVGGAVAHPF